MVVKKKKRKEQHQKAIAGYKAWANEHPKSTHQQKFDAFDAFVDTSIIEEIFQEAEHAPTT